MPLQNYKVSISTDRASWSYLQNVQSISLTVGVQAQLDQLKSPTGQIVIRYPNGYASPNANLITGTFIKIENFTNAPSSTYVVWVGKISNVVVDYGIPYSSSVGPADYLTISCEGFFAELGRMSGDNYSMAAGTLATQFATASTQSGVPMEWSGSPTRAGAATTVSGTWADWVARTALSNNARMWDGINDYPKDVYIRSPFAKMEISRYFTDNPSAPTDVSQRYDQITFDSLSDNYWTQVSVNSDGLATQTVTKAGATVPYRTYSVNTLNPTTGQALDFANYLLSAFQDAKFSIGSVSCLAEAQTGAMLLDNFAGTSQTFAGMMGTTTSVFFRGTEYRCVIEGGTMTATPDSSRFTFYFSAADVNNYLELDDGFYGRLNFNKLGY